MGKVDFYISISLSESGFQSGNLNPDPPGSGSETLDDRVCDLGSSNCRAVLATKQQHRADLDPTKLKIALYGTGTVLRYRYLNTVSVDVEVYPTVRFW